MFAAPDWFYLAASQPIDSCRSHMCKHHSSPLLLCSQLEGRQPAGGRCHQKFPSRRNCAVSAEGRACFINRRSQTLKKAAVTKFSSFLYSVFGCRAHVKASTVAAFRPPGRTLEATCVAACPVHEAGASGSRVPEGGERCLALLVVAGPLAAMLPLCTPDRGSPDCEW